MADGTKNGRCAVLKATAVEMPKIKVGIKNGMARIAVNIPARLMRAVSAPQNIPKQLIAGDPINREITHPNIAPISIPNIMPKNGQHTMSGKAQPVQLARILTPEIALRERPDI